MRFLAILFFGVGVNLAAQTLPMIRVHDGVSGEFRGSCVENIGDQDLDGFDDYLVGSPGANLTAIPGTGVSLPRGRIDIYSGKTGLPLASRIGDQPGDKLGQSIARVGDLNGDGSAEFIVGAPFSSVAASHSGLAYVLTMNPTLTVHHMLSGTVSNQRLGIVVDGGHDVDGDGTNDYMTYSEMISFGAVVQSGADNSVLIAANSWGQHRLVGDVDGDGLAEMIYNNGSGDYVLVDGTNPPFVFNLTVPVDRFSPIHDLTGDGIDDLLASGDDSFGVNFFSAVSFSPTLQTTDLNSLIGISGPARRLFPIGDVDSDGIFDAALTYHSTTTPSVTVSILRTDSWAELGRFTSNAGGGTFGEDIVSVGDISGDDVADLVISARGDQTVGTDAGRVYVSTFAGANRYGENLGVLQPLDLNWVPSSSSPYDGIISITGSTPYYLGLVGASLAPSNFQISFVPVLIDINPSLLVTQVTFFFDATGSLTSPLSITNPYIAGTIVYVQAFDLVLPYGSSNGLELLFR